MSWKLTVSMDSSLAAVRKASCVFREALQGVGDPSFRHELELAFVEACTNSAKHGGSGKNGEPIQITVEIDGGEVKVTLEDGGKPFDPGGRQAPIDTGNIQSLPTGGMGLPLIRRIFDSVTYAPSMGRNRLLLVKRIPAAPVLDSRRS